MRVTVGIPTRNRSSVLEECLLTLTRQTRKPDEVFVCNDASTDDTETILNLYRERFSKIGVALHFYTFPFQQRQAICRNFIASHAIGDILAFLDDDVLCPEGWLASLVPPFDQGDAIGAVGGPAIVVDKNFDFCSDIIYDHNPKSLHRFSRYGAHKGYFHCWVPDSIRESDFLCGGNMAIRKNVFQEVGSSDVRLKGHCQAEEVDLFIRIKRRGYKILYEPRALVYHRYHQSGARPSPRIYWYYSGYNHMMFLLKHFKKPGTFLRLAFCFRKSPTPIPGVLIASFLMKGNFARLWQILGYVDCLTGRDRLQGENPNEVYPSSSYNPTHL